MNAHSTPPAPAGTWSPRAAAVWFALGASVAVAVGTPLSAWAQAHASWVAAGAALAIGLVALWPRTWEDVALGVGVAASFATLALLEENAANTEPCYFCIPVDGADWGHTVTDPRLFLQSSAKLAFALLSLALVLGPLARLWPRVRSILGARRHVGVAAFLLAAAHALTVIGTSYQWDVTTALRSPYPFAGVIALELLALLALTSWNAFVGAPRHTGWSVLFGTLGVALAFQLAFGASAWRFSTVQVLAGAGCVLAVLLLTPWRATRLLPSVASGWKQLQRLVWVAYPAVVAHAWFMTVSRQSRGEVVVFWALVCAVAASHVAGWIRAWRRASEHP